MESFQHRLNFAVRDYELDFQGVVNNAVYQHYLEHSRHEFLKAEGIDVAGLSKTGIDLVLTNVALDYLHPLRSGDQFWVGTSLGRQSRLRFLCRQAIFRLPDDKPVLGARIVGTALKAGGRPCLPAALESLIAKYGLLVPS